MHVSIYNFSKSLLIFTVTIVNIVTFVTTLTIVNIVTTDPTAITVTLVTWFHLVILGFTWLQLVAL